MLYRYNQTVSAPRLHQHELNQQQIREWLAPHRLGFSQGTIFRLKEMWMCFFGGFFFFCFSMCLFVFLFVYRFIYLYLSMHWSVYLPICFSIYPSVCLSIYLSVCLPACLSICLSFLSCFLPLYMPSFFLCEVFDFPKYPYSCNCSVHVPTCITWWIITWIGVFFNFKIVMNFICRLWEAMAKSMLEQNFVFNFLRYLHGVSPKMDNRRYLNEFWFDWYEGSSVTWTT